MTWSATVFRGTLVALTALALSGCVPVGQSQADEEKEPHFMAGKKRVSTLDYGGAIESFEKALEVNPRSAAAHFELACLFDETDPAAAIHHFQSYLRLRPEAGNAVIVKQRIMTCKERLAQEVKVAPLSERQQRELEQLSEENKRLGLDVKRLSDELAKWQAYAGRLAGMSNQAVVVAPNVRPQTPSPGAGTSAIPPALLRPGDTAESTARTHTVKTGENATIIARKYGIKVDTLLAANPKADPRRLKVGQVLIVPAPDFSARTSVQSGIR